MKKLIFRWGFCKKCRNVEVYEPLTLENKIDSTKSSETPGKTKMAKSNIGDNSSLTRLFVANIRHQHRHFSPQKMTKLFIRIEIVNSPSTFIHMFSTMNIKQILIQQLKLFEVTAGKGFKAYVENRDPPTKKLVRAYRQNF